MPHVEYPDIIGDTYKEQRANDLLYDTAKILSGLTDVNTIQDVLQDFLEKHEEIY